MHIAISQIDIKEEFIEIVNTGFNSIDISGYRINGGQDGQNFVFPNGTIVDAGNTIRVYSGKHPEQDGELRFDGKRAVWNNKGDEATLFDYFEEVISVKNYGDRENPPEIKAYFDESLTQEIIFDTTDVLSPERNVVTIENNGGSDLVLELPLRMPGAFAVVSQPTKTIPPNGKSTFTIQFLSGKEGNFNGELPIVSNSAQTPVLITQGTAISQSRPEIRVERDGENIVGSVAFSATSQGKSTSLNLDIHNVGEKNLTVDDFVIDGANASEFSITSIPSSPIAAWKQSSINITFSPESTGEKTATLHFKSNDPKHKTIDISLTGEALPMRAEPEGSRIATFMHFIYFVANNGKTYVNAPMGYLGSAHAFHSTGRTGETLLSNFGQSALHSDGTVWANSKRVPGLENIVDLGVAFYPVEWAKYDTRIRKDHAELFCLDKDGQVWTSGEVESLNSVGAMRKMMDNVASVACGCNHAAFILNTGKVYVCGRYITQNCNYDSVTDVVSIAVSKTSSNPSIYKTRSQWVAALTSDGTVWAWGKTSGNHSTIQYLPVKIDVPDGVEFKSLHSTDDYIAAIDSDGYIWRTSETSDHSWKGWTKLKFPPSLDFDCSSQLEVALAKTGHPWVRTTGHSPGIPSMNYKGRAGYYYFPNPTRLPIA